MEYTGFALIPLVAGIGEVLKEVGLPCKYVQLFNFFNGVIIGLIAYYDIREGLVNGLYIGLSASGLVKCSSDAYNVYRSIRKSSTPKDKNVEK